MGRLSAKAILLRLMAVTLSLAPLVAIEAIVRVGGWATPPPPKVPEAYDPDYRAIPSTGMSSYLEAAEPGPDGKRRVQTNRQAAGIGVLLDVSFDAVPAPGTLRIFAFGGSATMGVPYETQPQLSFPSRLEHHLSMGGLKVEVINLGGASLGSRQVLEAAAEAMEYQPSALVIYSGNNEFFQYNLRLTEANKGMRLLRGRLDALHSVRLLRGALQKARGVNLTPNHGLGKEEMEALKDRQDAIVREALTRSVLAGGEALVPTWADGQPVERKDPHYRAVVDGYEANLRAIANLAAAKAQLFVVSMPANLEIHPTLSVHRPGLSAVDELRFDRAMRAGREAFVAKDTAAAEAAFTRALALDAMYAEAHYGRGRARLAAGKKAAAKGDLHNALELDHDPGRPVGAIRQVPYALEAEGLCVAIDGVAALTPDSKLGEASSIFVDRCHLSPLANDRLAWAIAEGMLSHWATRPPP